MPAAEKQGILKLNPVYVLYNNNNKNASVRGLDAQRSFSIIFYKGDNFFFHFCT